MRIDGTSTRIEYDAARRPVRVTDALGQQLGLAYDANGNRTSAGTVAATFDARDRIVSQGPVTYTHNANGEVLTRVDTSTGPTTRHD